MMRGVALGDALGMPVETFTAAQIKERFGRVETLIPSRDHKWFKNTPAGTWTDDTQLSVVMLEGLCDDLKGNLDRIAARHIDALRATDAGWGGTTREAIQALAGGTHWSESGIALQAKRGTGNGVVMKLCPVAAWWTARGEQDRAAIVDFTVQLAAMTHRTQLAVATAVGHLAAVSYCLTIDPRDFSAENFLSVVRDGIDQGVQKFPADGSIGDLGERLALLDRYQTLPLEAAIEAFGGGRSHLTESLPLSYYAFLRNPHSFESVLEAVNAGGDTDSNGSIVGGLLGALNGCSIMPSTLWDQILHRSPIESATERFIQGFHLGE
jgi:ADP-ribosylglycohydrolase